MSGYFDTAAAQPLHPAARETLVAALESGWADPRGRHGPARTARLLLDNAREAVADALGLRPDEVTFTTSGTDAVHRGLLGLRAARRRAGETVVHSAVEHSAVLHAAAWAGPAVPVGVDRLGRVDVAAFLEAAAAPGVAVAALQAANHEVGTTQPVAEVAAGLGPVPLLVDAGVVLGRLPLPAGWAAATASAHHWGGPAGVGLLLVRKGTRWRSPFPAEDRTDERAAGVEDVPAALAAAAALRAVMAERDAESARLHALVARLRAAAHALPEVDVVGDPDDRVPHLLTFSCLYADGEQLVDALDRRGLAVASGSACTSSTLEPSHVLAAMGALTHGNVRLSLGRATTEADVDALCAALPVVLGEIRAEVGQ